ncbi:hypothetical protein M430DRAFT_276577 [Amorphotheca resinae ATCC 22711]|uniref:Uncharacterized protein n=1 Tax=Amorphotheca resinae ATCC 22711 TaxID=857342 RepID=A0A2T3B022_AMORE|nr:hypothetical protein M430DRAFT_276577 [Amorphotheca resinae ATCC 22711]PSS16741.1 hypothetical protein M430DRAFT_276577 [Amorphotheca resinae ATCC 22711]
MADKSNAGNYLAQMPIMTPPTRGPAATFPPANNPLTPVAHQQQASSFKTPPALPQVTIHQRQKLIDAITAVVADPGLLHEGYIPPMRNIDGYLQPGRPPFTSRQRLLVIDVLAAFQHRQRQARGAARPPPAPPPPSHSSHSSFDHSTPQQFRTPRARPHPPFPSNFPLNNPSSHSHPQASQQPKTPSSLQTQTTTALTLLPDILPIPDSEFAHMHYEANSLLPHLRISDAEPKTSNHQQQHGEERFLLEQRREEEVRVAVERGEEILPEYVSRGGEKGRRADASAWCTMEEWIKARRRGLERAAWELGEGYERNLRVLMEDSEGEGKGEEKSEEESEEEWKEAAEYAMHA